MSRAARLMTMAFAATVLAPSASLADPSSPAVEERRQSATAIDAESEYNRGVRARVVKDWAAAVQAFRRALGVRSAFPDAWNELGYALRNQGRYADARRILDRLRPLDAERAKELTEEIAKGAR